MQFCRVECVAKVLKECCAFPTQASLNIGVGHPCPIEEVGCCDSDRVAGPFLEHGIILLETECCLCEAAEVGCDLVGCDVFVGGWTGWVWAIDGQWCIAWEVEALCPEAYAKGGVDGADGWALAVASEGNLLPIIVVLLEAPLHSD